MGRVQLEGSSVLLTGASTGIGRELALALSGRGASLAISARRPSLLGSLADELAARGQRRPVVLPADLSRRGNAAELATAAAEALGEVDILINNAGSGVGGYVATVGDRDPGREAFEVNYWSPLALIRSLVPAMVERERGAVVNVTSLAQITTWPGFGAYAATKAALATATETLAMELHDTGVHVLEVVPGPVDTALHAETLLTAGIERMFSRLPVADSAVLARRVVRALERGQDRLIYPPRARFAYAFPTAVRGDLRRLAARMSRKLDPGARDFARSRLVRSGFDGDSAAREARETWERARDAA